MIPLVTAFIAAVVAFIAFLQWQTAREKVLLDLFDKRFAVYDELRTAVARRYEPTAPSAFAGAASRARFLFDPKVQTFLEQIQEDLDREPLLLIRLSQPISEDQKEAVDAELAERTNRLIRFFKDFDELVKLYMNHHQKALRLRQSLVEVARSALKWLAPQSSGGER
jgi:hypothetical protein